MDCSKCGQEILPDADGIVRPAVTVDISQRDDDESNKVRETFDQTLFRVCKVCYLKVLGFKTTAEREAEKDAK